jgi:taurine dioxygenase
MGSSLYAIEVPVVGGDTKFSNLYAAFETLPAEFKRAIEGRRATHVFESGDYGVLSREAHAHNANSPRATHPIVCTHPVTGRQSLFVNRIMTERIEGLPADESDELLFRLFEHMERPEFIYTHRWTPGDLLLWDNRCTSHARTDFDPAERRHLRRFTIRGTKPV